MPPSTTEGAAVSSLVPFPKDSSCCPLAVSACLISVTFFQSRDGGDVWSTLRLASVSISKLLPERVTSPWEANAATCQPTTSAAMTPIPNNHLVRLLTTHSPYLLTSAHVAEPILERDRRTYL